MLDHQLAWYVAGPVSGLCVVACRARRFHGVYLFLRLGSEETEPAGDRAPKPEAGTYQPRLSSQT